MFCNGLKFGSIDQADTAGCIMLIDTQREKEIKLGTTYPFGPLSAGQCLVSSY
jgi:hypothetical protein